VAAPGPRLLDQGADHLVHADRVEVVGTLVGTLVDPTLEMLAATLDDVERTRIAAQNRLRQLTRSEADSDGEVRGAGLPEDHPAVAYLVGLVAELERVEHGAGLALNRQMRKHPLYPWVKGTLGVGERQAARLIAAVRDPYVDLRTNTPRTVSQLWAYSGLHVVPADRTVIDAQGPVVGGDQIDPGDRTLIVAQDGSVPGVAPRRRRGVRANWSSTAKMRAYLIAESCVKQTRSPYRAVYDARRAHTAVTRPDWTAGHSHADAMRVVSKRVLRDLWRAAHDVYAERAEAAEAA
jgi:hypothetical protein